ncbi:hypothetical protein ABZ464_43350 [Streptomyces sp. NPDC005820]|uniref:hypothetical protein n=1 Tax=Streptomyces sp. NPDC005820 TaxID=3157069 RepID=UPI003411A633
MRIRTITAAVSGVLALSALSSLATPAAADPAPVAAAGWTAPKTLAASQQSSLSPQKVKVGDNGTSAALWKRTALAGDQGALLVSVRQPGTAVWATRTLSATPVDDDASSLVVAPDGTVTAVWAVYPTPGSGTGAVRLLSSVRGPGSAVWSRASLVDSASEVNGVDAVVGADGVVRVVWSAGDGTGAREVRSSVRQTAAGSWSAPALLSASLADSAHAVAPRIAVAADGSATAVWWNRPAGGVSQGSTASATLLPSAVSWSEPVTVSSPADNPKTAPQLSEAATGKAAVTWTEPTSSGLRVVKLATRSGPSAAWSAPQTVSATTSQYLDHPVPLVRSDGAITLVWLSSSGSADAGDVRTVTRGAAATTWPAATTLSSDISTGLDAAQDADGTVHTVWGESGNGQWAFRSASRVGGSWNASVTLGTSSRDASTGVGISAANRRAIAMWGTQMTDGDSNANLSYATTGTPPVVVAPAKVSGTVRAGRTVTCSATWAGAASPTFYGWLRDGRTIGGARGASHKLTGADYDHKISCRALATNAAGGTTSTSPTVRVRQGDPLKATTAPKIQGTVQVGRTLTASKGVWNVEPTEYTYRWKRSGSPIAGAVNAQYKLVEADRYMTVTVTVKAFRYGFAGGVATTAPVLVIQ